MAVRKRKRKIINKSAQRRKNAFQQLRGKDKNQEPLLDF